MRKIGKKLITINNYKGYISPLEGKMYVSNDMVLTPGVKDAIRNKGIVICYGEKEINKLKDEKVSDEVEITSEIVRLLTSEYGIQDKFVIEEMAKKVIEKL